MTVLEMMKNVGILRFFIAVCSGEVRLGLAVASVTGDAMAAMEMLFVFWHGRYGGARGFLPLNIVSSKF